MSAYSTSKAGVIALTRCMAVDFARYGIRVNCIVPGFIDTPLVAPFTDERRRKVLGEIIPLGRMGQPEEIANVAAFLASDRSDYITGQVIAVCGGLT